MSRKLRMASSRRFIQRVRRRVYARDYRYACSISDSYDGSAKGSVKFNFNDVTSDRRIASVNKSSLCWRWRQIFPKFSAEACARYARKTNEMSLKNPVAAWQLERRRNPIFQFRANVVDSRPSIDFVLYSSAESCSNMRERASYRTSRLGILSEGLCASSMTNSKRFERKRISRVIVSTKSENRLV